jgi:hypothetical protein
MAWSSTGNAVVAALQKQKQAMDSAVELAANQGKIMALNEVHARMVGHIRTGNMNDGFDRASDVTKFGECHYQIKIATDATSNGFPYPNVVEAKFGMMSGGVHAALPQIAANLKEKIENAK